MALSNIVSFAIVIEAAVMFYWVHCFTHIYRVGHAPLSWILLAGWPISLDGIILIIAAFVYWRFKRVRPMLAMLAILGAVYGASTAWSSRYFVGSYRAIFDGDLVAISAIISIGLIIIGILAIVDQILFMAHRKARSF